MYVDMNLADRLMMGATQQASQSGYPSLYSSDVQTTCTVGPYIYISSRCVNRRLGAVSLRWQTPLCVFDMAFSLERTVTGRTATFADVQMQFCEDEFPRNWQCLARLGHVNVPVPDVDR